MLGFFLLIFFFLKGFYCLCEQIAYRQMLGAGSLANAAFYAFGSLGRGLGMDLIIVERSIPIVEYFF